MIFWSQIKQHLSTPQYQGVCTRGHPSLRLEIEIPKRGAVCVYIYAGLESIITLSFLSAELYILAFCFEVQVSSFNQKGDAQ
jgi:hypothetical protein